MLKTKPITKIALVVAVAVTVFIVAYFGKYKGHVKDKEAKYSELFAKGLKESTQTRNPYLGLLPRYRGLKNHGKLRFEPIPGLDKPEVISFLVDVIRNGPKWLREQDYHIAKCYATLCLGATKDARALGPLTEALKIVDEKEKYEYVAKYAAIGLGLLGHPDAVEPLIKALEDKRLEVRYGVVWALGEFGDFRAINPLIKKFESKENYGVRANYGEALTKILKMKVSNENLPNHQFWVRWWKEGHKFTEERFEKIYLEWKNMKRETKIQRILAKRKLNEMSALGIAALPFMIEKVAQGDTTFISAISNLMDGELKKTATQEQCLEWWNKNKHKWLIPFDKSKAESGTESQK